SRGARTAAGSERFTGGTASSPGASPGRPASQTPAGPGACTARRSRMLTSAHQRGPCCAAGPRTFRPDYVHVVSRLPVQPELPALLRPGRVGRPARRGRGAALPGGRPRGGGPHARPDGGRAVPVPGIRPRGVPEFCRAAARLFGGDNVVLLN